MEQSLNETRFILPELVTSLTEVASKDTKIRTASGRPLEDQLKIFSSNSLGALSEFPRFLIANEQKSIFRERIYEALTIHNGSIRKAWLEALSVAKEIVTRKLMRLMNTGIQVKMKHTW